MSSVYQQAVGAVPSSLQLSSLQMQFLNMRNDEMNPEDYDALMVERRISEALSAESKEKVKLPMIKYKEWASGLRWHCTSRSKLISI